MTTSRIVLRCVLLTLQVLLTFSLATRIQAQTPTPTPKSEELQKLEEQQALAQARAAIAVANKTERDAKFPSPTTSPLAGTTTVNDAAVIESQMVAYVSMARAANKLVSALKDRPGQINNLAVLNDADVKLLLNYKVAYSQIELLRQAYGQLLGDDIVKACASPSPTPSGPSAQEFIPGLGIAKSFLGAFVDLTALLRTNVEIKGQTFDIDEAPLVSEVFRAARCQYGNGIKLYYPGVFPPDIGLPKEYVILKKLEELHCLRVAAGKLIGDIEKNEKNIDESEAKIKTIKATITQTKASRDETEAKIRHLLKGYCPKFPTDQPILIDGLNESLRRFCPRLQPEQREDLFALRDQLADLDEQMSTLGVKLKTEAGKHDQLVSDQATLWKKLQQMVSNSQSADDIAAQLKALNEQVDKLIGSLVQVETATGTNLLTMYIKAENLKAALPANDSFWLQLKVVKAGGNNRIKTNLIWDIFTGGNRVSHSGGAIVEYILYDTTGKSVASDTITEYTNYIKAGKVKNLSDSTVDDIGCPCVNKRSSDCTKEKNQ